MLLNLFLLLGPVGTWINDYHKLEFERILKQIQKQKAREGIPDEELVLEEHPGLKVVTNTIYNILVCNIRKCCFKCKFDFFFAQTQFI